MVLTCGWQFLKFRHTLTDDTLRMWEEIRNKCVDVELEDHDDTITSKLDPKGCRVTCRN